MAVQTLFLIPKTALLIDNHMNGRLADAKLLCGGTDGGPVLYDVQSQALGPVLHISLQKHSLPALWCFQSMRRRGVVCAFLAGNLKTCFPVSGMISYTENAPVQEKLHRGTVAVFCFCRTCVRVFFDCFFTMAERSVTTAERFRPGGFPRWFRRRKAIRRWLWDYGA